MQPQPTARERLLDAAEDLAATQGVSGTPVDLILARARVSPATLYAHFGNKEGLVTQALQRRLTRWDRTWQECIDQAHTPEDAVLAVFDALGRYRRDAGPSRWCVFLGVTAETPDRGPELDDVLAADTRLLSTRLQELATPVVGAGAAGAAADHLVLIYTGVLGMLLRGTDAESVIATGRSIAAATLHAFRAEGSA
jgi:AcrR family transcriptional regulator